MTGAASTSASTVAFGTAHLLVDRMSEATARGLLEAAIGVGIWRLDTAPLYGHGGSEPLVASVAKAHPEVVVTTKVGLEPVAAPSRLRRLAGAVSRQLPRAAVERLRRASGREAPPPRDAPSGRFDVAVTRRSIERSLARLGAVDRLLLHEVHAADITDELLDLLRAYRARGDVRAIGIATGNAITPQCLARGQGLFSVAHVSLDPLGEPTPDLADWPGVQRVGHGVLGPSARTLACLERQLTTRCDASLRWQQAAAGSPYAAQDGLALALFARAASRGSTELVFATRRRAALARTLAAARLRPPLSADASAAIEALLRAASSSVSSSLSMKPRR